jgi:cation transport regulator ChaB
MPHRNAAGSSSEREELPSTIARSPKKVQDTYLKALANAHKTYEGNEAAAHRVAYAAVKHIAERVGDHWELKKTKGPSDPEAAEGGPPGIAHPPKPTFGGVDVFHHSKVELQERAKKLGIAGVSRMTKTELARAIERRQQYLSRRRNDRTAL